MARTQRQCKLRNQLLYLVLLVKDELYLYFTVIIEIVKFIILPIVLSVSIVLTVFVICILIVNHTRHSGKQFSDIRET